MANDNSLPSYWNVYKTEYLGDHDQSVSALVSSGTSISLSIAACTPNVVDQGEGAHGDGFQASEAVYSRLSTSFPPATGLPPRRMRC